MKDLECDHRILFPAPTVEDNVECCLQRSGLDIDFGEEGGVPFNDAHLRMENELVLLSGAVGEV